MIPNAIIDKARAVRIEDVIGERRIKLSPGKIERCGPCPSCGGTDRFSVNLRKQVFNCRGCGECGDVIALVRLLDGVDFRTAVEALAGPARETSFSKEPPVIAKPKDAATDRRRKINIARGIWNRRRPVIGTVAEHYLRFRGLDIDANHLDYMGFDPEAEWREDPDDPASPLLRVPCLIAGYKLIEGIDDGIVAIQKTRLNPDGSKWSGATGKTARRFNGSPKGAVIKIDRDEDVTMGLILGEGLETTLSARALGFRPVWAAGSAGAIGTFPVLAGIECLTLLTERDESGANMRAVEACTRQWQAAGKEVLWADPPEGCGDVNDILQKGMARA